MSEINSVLDLFFRQVQKSPDKVALIEGARTISYRQLFDQSAIVASSLRQLGIKPGNVVAIITEPDIEVIIIILGILQCGATYLPIDKSFPEARKKYLISNSHATLIIGRNLSPKRYKNTLVAAPENLLQQTGAKTILQTQDWPQGNSLIYLIYTSGTTGKPKGVTITHVAALNYLNWAARTYLRKDEQYFFPLFTSLAFDLTVTTLFLPLITGNTIVIYNADNTVQMLFDALHDVRINIIKCTPSHLNFFDSETLQKSNLKKIIVGGEDLPVKKAWEISSFLGHQVQIFNEYGPTEATVGCSCHLYDYKKDLEGSVPIGNPIDNTSLLLLDHNKQIIWGEGMGELYIAGAGLATGYLNAPELTKEKFIPVTIEGKQVLAYKTGDLVQSKKGGNLYFKGRTDDQVKVGGYRVELGEVEAALMKIAEIEQAVVLVDEGLGLCAWIKTYESPAVEFAELVKESLSDELPYWMIPKQYFFVKKFPLTAHGKVDKARLKNKQTITGSAKKSTATEKALLQIFSDLLDTHVTSSDADFFRLGGDSLRALQLARIIKDQFEIEVPLSYLFKSPTVKSLTRYIETKAGSVPKSAGLQTHSAELNNRFLLYNVQKSLFFEHLIAPKSLRYNLTSVWDFSQPLHEERIIRALKAIIEKHAILRTTFYLEDGKVSGKIHNDARLSYKKVRVASEEEALKEIRSFVTPFDLAQLPLFRVLLIQTGASRFKLVMDKHHIIFDGFSEKILIEDFKKHYEEQQLNSLPFQYHDFINWQELYLTLSYHSSQTFWKQRLKSFNQEPTLPIDFPRPNNPLWKGSQIYDNLNEHEVSYLKDFAKATDTTIFSVLLALYFVMLHKISQKRDLAVITFASHRPETSLQNNIGMFVNTLPLRLKLDINKPFSTFPKQIKMALGDMLEHQGYPFSEILKLMGKQRNQLLSPTFNASIAYHDYLPQSFDLEGNIVKTSEVKHDASIFDLNLDIMHKENGIELCWGFNTEVLDQQSIRSYLTLFKQLMTGALKEPSVLIKSLTSLKERKVRHMATSSKPSVTPGTSLGEDEKLILRLFNKHISAKNIDITEDFFSVGGNSLSFMSLLFDIEKATGIALSPAQVIQDASVLSIARLLRKNEQKQQHGMWLSPQQSMTIVCFPPALGNALIFKQMAEAMPHYSVYAFDFNKQADLIEQYAHEILSLGKKNLILLGYSGGGNLAFETAKLLEQEGVKITDVILLDAFRKSGKPSSLPKDVEDFRKKLKSNFDSEGVFHQIIDDYYDFINFELKDYQGKIQANIHLISSEERNLFEKIRFNGKPYFSSWTNGTAGNYLEYRGHGPHASLLQDQFLSMNTKMIEGILGGEKSGVRSQKTEV